MNAAKLEQIVAEEIYADTRKLIDGMKLNAGEIAFAVEAAKTIVPILTEMYQKHKVRLELRPTVLLAAALMIVIGFSPTEKIQQAASEGTN